jgi:DNA uptake protein ComE-like DNA-binding protein
MYFEDREVRGLSLLTILMMFIVVLFVLKELIYPFKQSFEPTPEDLKILSELQILDKKERKRADVFFEKKRNTNFKNKDRENEKFAETEKFPFDPNKLSEKEWHKLGVKSFLAKRIVNYTAKNGVFRIKKDLLKIYGFPEETYKKLESYILLPEEIAKPSADKLPEKTALSEEKPVKSYKTREVKIIDVNSADSAALCEVRGLGAVLSSRIVKFREKLGGFINKEQLKEVYGLREESFLMIKEGIFIADNFSPKKININADVKKGIATHPYIGYKKAETILAYRKNHGNLKSLEDVAKIGIFSEEEVKKLAPYLRFD